MYPGHLLTRYPAHRLRRRGQSIHAIPVSSGKPHRAHHKCHCKPRHVVPSPTKCPWHGVWEHN